MNTLYESLLTNVKSHISNDDAIIYDIKQFISKCELSGSYHIHKQNNEWVVDVDGSIRLPYTGNSEDGTVTGGLFRFGKVTGAFEIRARRDITSLKNSPESCNELHIAEVDIEDMAYCPEVTEAMYIIRNCKLASLKGIRTSKKLSTFNCMSNAILSSTKYSPVSRNYYFDNNPSLVELTGLPRECDTFSVRCCEELKSIKGAPKRINKNFDCSLCTFLSDLAYGPVYMWNADISGTMFMLDVELTHNPKIISAFRRFKAKVKGQLIEY